MHLGGHRPLYTAYHDTEWGVPVHDDQRLFEFLILEGAQAGLSWITILRKRDNYRAAFDDFDAEKVAYYSAKKIELLLQNPGIIRNRLKVAAAVTNAQAFLKVQEEFESFDHYLWRFVSGAHPEPLENSPTGSDNHTGIRRHEQGSQKTRLQVRGLDNLLRTHAGVRHGQ